ncbi:MAG: DUF177 domain-containing protein [bacterium]|nr:DUF177 domain-containing protein [bacterium]
MNIDLNSFEREKAIDETLQMGGVDLGLANARVGSAIRLDGKAVKSAGVIALTGRLSGSVELDCDRCLEPVERPLDIELDLEFVPNQRLADKANVELHPDDLKRDEIDGSEIDLVDIAREQILLDLPHQFFCMDDCKGLCEKCGANLNLKVCDCEDNEIDPRWAGLQNLN